MLLMFSPTQQCCWCWCCCACVDVFFMLLDEQLIAFFYIDTGGNSRASRCNILTNGNFNFSMSEFGILVMYITWFLVLI